MCTLSHSPSVRRARHEAAQDHWYSWLSLRLCGVHATRLYIVLYLYGKLTEILSVTVDRVELRPYARSVILKSDRLKFSHHRHLIRHSLTRKLICYHTAVLCKVFDGINCSVFATTLLGLRTRYCLVRQRFLNGISSHGISHRLATPVEPRGNTSQQPLSKHQQDFASREGTLGFSFDRSQLRFSSGFSQRWFSSSSSHLLLRILTNFTGFLSLIIMLNVRLFSTAHHRCGIIITGPTHKRRQLIQCYVSEVITQIHATILSIISNRRLLYNSPTIKSIILDCVSYCMVMILISDSQRKSENSFTLTHRKIHALQVEHSHTQTKFCNTHTFNQFCNSHTLNFFIVTFTHIRYLNCEEHFLYQLFKITYIHRILSDSRRKYIIVRQRIEYCAVFVLPEG